MSTNGLCDIPSCWDRALRDYRGGGQFAGSPFCALHHRDPNAAPVVTKPVLHCVCPPDTPRIAIPLFGATECGRCHRAVLDGPTIGGDT